LQLLFLCLIAESQTARYLALLLLLIKKPVQNATIKFVSSMKNYKETKIIKFTLNERTKDWYRWGEAAEIKQQKARFEWTTLL
jgi:hypothetical protein